MRNIYYLVENHREGKKVKRKTLLALGVYKTVAELLEASKNKETGLLNALVKHERNLERFITKGEYDDYPLAKFDSYSMRKKYFIKNVERTKKDLALCQKKIEHIKLVL